jgi:hypothetical protein
MPDAPTNEDRKAQALEDIAKSLEKIEGHLFQIHGFLVHTRKGGPFGG